MKITQLTLFFLMLLYLLNGANNAVALPKEIQADRYMASVKMYLEENNHIKALEYMEKKVQLGVKMPPAFYFKYGKSLKSVGKTVPALKQIEKYLELAGRSGKYYQEALTLYTKLEEQKILDERVIFDKTTGLMWQEREPGKMDWKKAIGNCQNLIYAGYSDWRLPDINELKSALIIKQKFPNINQDNSFYWSSSAYEGYAGGGWGVNFGYDWVAQGNESKNYNVRCVRGGQ